MINGLPPGALVLVGVEYGPTSAAELDGLTRVLLRHVLLREARPVIVSGSPVALLRADNILAEMSAAEGWQPNQDYFVVRYLPGGNIGLRSLSSNTGPLLANDLRGQLTGLDVTGLRDFTALLVITDRPEDMRNWVEQVAPLAGRPFVGASGFATAPLAQPYVGAALTGLLVGYADALTYEQMLSAPASAEIEATLPVIVPATEEPTPTPTQTFTPSPEPPTATPTPPAIGVINATSAINLREGAGASFAIIGSLEPGAEVEVLSLETENGFVNVRLPDGTEGWVSESLIVVLPMGDLLIPPTATATEPPTATSTPRSTDTPAPSSTPLPATTQPPTATNTSTPAPTATPTSSPTPVPTVITARVTASERVNIRSGPGTGFTPVGTAGFGDTFVVIGRNSAGDWIQIEFGDAEEAWIAAFLVEVSAAEADDDSSSAPTGITLLTGGGLPIAPYVAQAETTPEATAEADDDTVPPVVDDTPATATLAADDLSRWYSMNLGLAAIIAIIILGALVNIGRALLRRRG